MALSRIESYDIRQFTFTKLNEEYLGKLLSDGIDTVTKFLMKTQSEILLLTDMSHSEYDKFADEIYQRCRPKETNLCPLLIPSINNPIKAIFSTGIKKLDAILEGGLSGGEILEIYGISGTGKTQMCLSIAAEFCHRRDSVVAYIDLKNDFVPQRFSELCQGSAESLGRIYLFRENKVRKIIDLIENLEKIVSDGGMELLRVIILDSLPMMFFPCRDEVPRMYQERLSQSLRRLANRYNLIIITTNHTVKDKPWLDKPPDRSSTSFGSEYDDETKPALGLFWFKVPHFRLFLTQTQLHFNFHARLCKSSRTPLDETFDYKITKAGIH